MGSITRLPVQQAQLAPDPQPELSPAPRQGKWYWDDELVIMLAAHERAMRASMQEHYEPGPRERHLSVVRP